MNRRDFLRRLTVGGIAAATAAREWPFRVFSFPQKIKIAPMTISPEARVRFIRAFDPAQAKMVNRWDVLYGFIKLDEANRVPFYAHPETFSKIEIASPEEARKLGLVDEHIAAEMEESCRMMASEFETTAIAPPNRFIERYKSEESWRLPRLTGNE